MTGAGTDAYCREKIRKMRDNIQLWCRITKTEYSDPPDTGDLPFCCPLSEWECMNAGMGRTGRNPGCSKRRFNAAEHLVHTTKTESRPGLILISAFPKMPSYLRRSGGSPACAGECILLSDASGSSGKQRDGKTGKP